MIKAGDIISYKKIEGEVKAVMQDMLIVKLADGKEYSLPYDAVTVGGKPVDSPSEMQGIMDALKPLIKNVSFLNEMASMMSLSGINELHVKAGKIQKFEARESLEEKIARYKAEALAEAEKKARDEHAQEMSII